MHDFFLRSLAFIGLCAFDYFVAGGTVGSARRAGVDRWRHPQASGEFGVLPKLSCQKSDEKETEQGKNAFSLALVCSQCRRKARV